MLSGGLSPLSHTETSDLYEYVLLTFGSADLRSKALLTRRGSWLACGLTLIRCATCAGNVEVSAASSSEEPDFESHLPASVNDFQTTDTGT